MGLFDFLFGRNKHSDADDDPPAPGPPPMPTPDAWEDMDWPARVRWYGDELEQVKAACDKAGIRVSPELNKAELRGIYKGRPVAVEIDDDGAAESLVKFINRRNHLSLGPPLAGITDRKQDEEFWSDDSDTVAPRVGGDTCIYATSKTIDASLATWNELDASVRERVVAWMQTPLQYLAIRHQEIETHMMVGPPYQVPVAPTILRCFDELVALTEPFGVGEAPIPPQGLNAQNAAMLPDKQVCAYCNTSFYVDRSDTRCPACGANS